MAEFSAYHQQRITAYHEAGHAVVGYILGGSVRSIEIGVEKHPDGSKSAGRVFYNGWPDGGSIDQATISVAGCVAQSVAGYPVSGSGRGDRINTQRYLHPNGHLEPVMTRRAEAIIKANWHYIGTLAAVLQQRRRLTATDLKRVMSGWRFGPPDRVSIPGADDNTRLLLYTLIYPERRGPMTPDWAQKMVAERLPEIAAAEAADLLRFIIDCLKTCYRDFFHHRDREAAVDDITLIENLAVAADRYHRGAVSRVYQVPSKADDDANEARIAELRALFAPGAKP